MSGSVRVRWSSGEQTFAPGQIVRIGREPGSDVELDEPTVSRRHAELTCTDGRWTLRDLASAQGTWIDGVRIDQMPIVGTITAVLGDTGTGARLEFIVAAADDPTSLRTGGASVGDEVPSAPGTVLVGSGPARPGGRLSDSVVGGATVITGDAINVECSGRSYTFHPGATVVIGRDEGADVIVTNPTVSRRHATLHHGPQGWTLTDTSSAAGTFVDGRRITTHALTGSTAVQLGTEETGERLVAVASGGAPPSSLARLKRAGRRNPVLLVVGLIAVLALATALFAATRPRDSGPDDDQLARATVRIETDQGSGSGTIIDASRGLILTNAHVADPDAPGLAVLYGEPDPDGDTGPIMIQVAPGLDRAAETRFEAEVVASDGYIDVAVLKIVKTARGAFLEEGDLDGLVDVEIGSSGSVRSGTPVNVFGYPGNSESKAVSLTKGVVGGTVQDDRLGTNRAFLNIDNVIRPGNSGGLAADDDGRIIGIPTLSRQRGPGQPVSSLRPIDLARPVITAALDGKKYRSKVPIRAMKEEAIDDVAFGDLARTAGLVQECADGTAPEVGDGAIGLSFDYSGFVAGEHQDIMIWVIDSQDDTVVGSWANSEDYPTTWSKSGCATASFALESELAAGDYAIAIYLGPSYELAYEGSFTVS